MNTTLKTMLCVAMLVMCLPVASASQWLKYEFNTASSVPDLDFLNTAPPVAGATKNLDGEHQDGYGGADPGDPELVQLQVPGRKVIQGLRFKGEFSSGNGTTIQPRLDGINATQEFPANFSDAMSTAYWVSFDADPRDYMTLLSIGSNGHAPGTQHSDRLNNMFQHHDHGGPYDGTERHFSNNGFFNHNPGYAEAQNSGELLHLIWTLQGDYPGANSRKEKIYVNGVLKEETSTDYGPLTTSNGYAPRIGRNVANNSNNREFFKGNMYQFEIWDEPLSDSDVAAMYAAGPSIHHMIVPESTSVMGDFNGDNTVDAADYTIWQDNLGLDASLLSGNGSGAATVVQADYLLWKTNFGQSAASGSANHVPEPTTLLLALLALTAVPLRVRCG